MCVCFENIYEFFSVNCATMRMLQFRCREPLRFGVCGGADTRIRIQETGIDGCAFGG